MISWLHPAALAGLALIVAPIAVHLLTRHRAEHLPFPSLRFVSAARTASFRMRSPSDLLLLLVRIAVIGSAALALAQPILNTAARRETWNARLSRAIVVDPAVAASQPAKEAADAESRGAPGAVHIAASTLRDALQAAIAAVSATLPSRREVVVISDFRHRSLGPADIAAVPAAVGLRFVRVDGPQPSPDFTGDTTLGAPGVSPRVQRLRVTGEDTDVDLKDVGLAREGLRVETSPDQAAIVLRTVARAGAPAPDPQEPLALVFVDGPMIREKGRSTLAPWMLRTVVRMRRDPLLLEAARVHVRGAPAAELPGIAIALDRRGAPVLAAFPRGSELVLLVAAAPADFLTVAALQRALVARRGEPRWDEHEVVRIPGPTLASWTRAPRSVSETDIRPPAPGDARWMWGGVLALLVLETVLRKRRSYALEGKYADAA
jgi:hypothetical protein